MIIWRGALARTGGTVCSEIVTALLTASNVPSRKVTVDQITSGQQNGDQPYLDSEEIYVGASDIWYDEIMAHPSFRVFYIWRDLRDTMASLRRFTHCDFQLIQDQLPYIYDHAAFFRGLPPNTCLQLSYSQDVLATERLTFRLAGFLALPVKATTVREIAANFDQNNMRKKLANQEARVVKELEQAWSEPQVNHLTFRIRTSEGIRQYYIPEQAFDKVSRDKVYKGGYGNFYMTLPSGVEIGLATNNDGDGCRITQFDTAGEKGIDRGNLSMRLQVGHITAKANDDWSTPFSDQEAAWLDEHTKPWIKLYGDLF